MKTETQTLLDNIALQNVYFDTLKEISTASDILKIVMLINKLSPTVTANEVRNTLFRAYKQKLDTEVQIGTRLLNNLNQ